MAKPRQELPFHCEDCPSKGKGIFCELEGLALQDLDHQKVVNTYKKGQTLFVEGNPPYGLYCISKGNIKVTKMSPAGKDALVRIASSGDVLGHRSIFTDEHYQATATAIEDTVVCFIDKSYILGLVRKQPAVAIKLIEKLGRDLGASEDRIASYYQKSVRERLAELLLLLKESHGEKEELGWKINIKLTREEMAAIIGTASETLIRFISELKEDGLVEQVGKTLYIVDEEKLVEQASLEY